MKNFATAGVVFFTLFTFSSLCRGGELMATADAFEAGAFQLSFYGQAVEKEPVVEVSGSGTIQVPVSGGTSGVFAQTNAEIEMESEYESAVAALTIRPHDGLHYRFKVGQVRDYELAFASGSLTNQFRSQSDGLVWGFGARWNAAMPTMVSAGISIDISYTQIIVDFDRFQSGSVVSATNQRLEQEEIQGAFNVSKRWKTLEPYGGVKIIRSVTHLKDQSTQGEIRGEKDEFSPFIGLSWAIFPNETLLIEASILDEEMISAGFNIRFN